MKLIHCADLHLDAKMESTLPREKAKERRQEILKTFTRMVEAGAEAGVEAILLCGDLFDAKTISARARNCVLDAVRTHPQILFYYLQGNHDQNSFLEDLSGEDFPENLRTFGAEWRTYGQNGVFITGAEITEETAGGLMDRLVLDADHVNLVMLHGAVSEYGAKDKKGIFSLKALRDKNIDYLALGHIHSYRAERLDSRGIWCYSGCLEGRGFDECGQKGYVLLTVEDGKVSHEFVPFAERTCHEVMADVTGLLTQEEILGAVDCALKDIPEQDLVKVVLTGETKVEAEKDAAWLEGWLKDRFYFLKVKDETRLAIRPEDFQYDISLKGEFVRLVLASRMSRAEKEEVLRLGIRTLAGEE